MSPAARFWAALRFRRGSIWARCHRISFWVDCLARASSVRLCGCNHSGFMAEIFSAASAHRMRTTGSPTDSPRMISQNRAGLSMTFWTTKLDLPIDRRSPPANSSTIVLIDHALFWAAALIVTMPVAMNGIRRYRRPISFRSALSLATTQIETGRPTHRPAKRFGSIISAWKLGGPHHGYCRI